AQITEEMARHHARAMLALRFDRISRREPVDEIRKIDAGGDGERQRSPEPAVDLHEPRDAVGRVDPKLDHNRSGPLERRYQALGAGANTVMRQRNGFGNYSRAPGRWQRPNATVSAGSENRAILAKQLHATLLAGHELLDQRGLARA